MAIALAEWYTSPGLERGLTNFPLIFIKTNKQTRSKNEPAWSQKCYEEIWTNLSFLFYGNERAPEAQYQLGDHLDPLRTFNLAKPKGPVSKSYPQLKHHHLICVFHFPSISISRKMVIGGYSYRMNMEQGPGGAVVLVERLHHHQGKCCSVENAIDFWHTS